MRRKKNYLLQERADVINLDEHQSAPWVVKLDGLTCDFRRWQYLDRPKLPSQIPIDSKAIFSVNLPDGKPVLQHANRDVLVAGILRAIWRQRGRWRNNTLHNICNSVTPFFRFLDERYRCGEFILNPQQLTKELIERYVQWLLESPPQNPKRTQNSYTGAKSKYAPFSNVLRGLADMKLIEWDAILTNAFPRHRQSVVPTHPYTKKEMDRVIAALGVDLDAIRTGSFKGVDSDILTIYFLIFAARTGRNLVPLLELERDSLADHPIKPSQWSVLTLYKNRGTVVQQQSFLKKDSPSQSITIATDIVTLYKEILKFTAPMLSIDEPQNLNKLWLFRPRVGRAIGKPEQLSENALKYGILRFVTRHGLESDDGNSLAGAHNRLNLNVRRLRATFVQRLWRLSGGDLLKTAILAGNTPRMTDSHYLEVTSDMARNFRFVGHAYELALRDGGVDISEKIQADLNVKHEDVIDIIAGKNNTGVARCSDPKHGRYAPGDGVHFCTVFLKCFKCPNQVILESDLFRLFSFYWLIYRERHYLNRTLWKKTYWWVLQEIDLEISPKFKRKSVRDAKLLAYKEPHPLWKTREILIGGVT